jgi:hypothetical protein
MEDGNRGSQASGRRATDLAVAVYLGEIIQ